MCKYVHYSIAAQPTEDGGRKMAVRKRKSEVSHGRCTRTRAACATTHVAHSTCTPPPPHKYTHTLAHSPLFGRKTACSSVLRAPYTRPPDTLARLSIQTPESARAREAASTAKTVCSRSRSARTTVEAPFHSRPHAPHWSAEIHRAIAMRAIQHPRLRAGTLRSRPSTLDPQLSTLSSPLPTLHSRPSAPPPPPRGCSPPAGTTTRTPPSAPAARTSPPGRPP